MNTVTFTLEGEWKAYLTTWMNQEVRDFNKNIGRMEEGEKHRA
jgi:hypothetical protein